MTLLGLMWMFEVCRRVISFSVHGNHLTYTSILKERQHIDPHAVFLSILLIREGKDRDEVPHDEYIHCSLLAIALRPIIY